MQSQQGQQPSDNAPPQQMNAQQTPNPPQPGFASGQQDPRINQDVPMGDPIQTIAQMLCLDLSTFSSPDQQGQAVVTAVEALVNKLHELSGQPVEDAVQDSEQEQYTDPGAEQEYQSDQDQPQEAEDSGEDSEENTNDEPPPQQRRPIAASFSEMGIPQRVLKVAGAARTLKIQQLAASGHITPATAKALSLEYCNVNALSLSLSLEDDEVDNFDKTVQLLERNGPVINFGEQSGPQNKLSRIKPTGMMTSFDTDQELTEEELTSEKTNPLVAKAAQLAADADVRRKRALSQ